MKRMSAGLILAAGVILSAAPAFAHTGAVTGSAVCEENGTYSIEWTYNATNVPDGIEAETKAMTTSKGSLAPVDGVLKGGQVFLSVWAEHQINVPGAPVKTGNWSAVFETVDIPGDYSGKVTTMVQTDWKGGPSEDPVGEVPVDGTCKPPVKEEPTPTPTPTPTPIPTPEESATPSPTPTPVETPVQPTPEPTQAPSAEPTPTPSTTAAVVRTTSPVASELAATGGDYDFTIPLVIVGVAFVGGVLFLSIAAIRRRNS